MTEKPAAHTRRQEVLANPPIIEAILEVQWAVFKGEEHPPLDSRYKLLPGRLYETVKDRYPYIEVLMNSTMPDEMNPNIPRYRFRSKAGCYPLIQIGPGVMTVNLDKTNFLSQDMFHDASMQALSDLYSVIDVEFNRMHIHYIDAFDYGGGKMSEFLKSKLRLNFSFQPELFDAAHLSPEPDEFLLETSYRTARPKGQFRCRLRKGRKPDGGPVILMDTICASQEPDVPEKEKRGEWIHDADDLIHDWFYEMIRDYKELW